jgi:hypothetical protein
VNDGENLLRILVAFAETVEPACESGPQSKTDSIVVGQDVSKRLQQVHYVVLFLVLHRFGVLQERLDDQRDEVVLAQHLNACTTLHNSA